MQIFQCNSIHSTATSVIKKLQALRAQRSVRRALAHEGLMMGTTCGFCEPLETRQMLTGTWSTVTASAPVGAQTGVVLTDGSILVHTGNGGASNGWEKLTPSSTGSYTAGSWTTLANSNVSRLYTATNMLTSGKVFVAGGEYSSDNGGKFSRSAEIYDPVANSWTSTALFPQSQFGDDPSELLPNGNVLTGYVSGATTYIYNPTTNAWSTAATKLRNDQSDEESWVVLPDHSIISYDVFASVTNNNATAQRYYPSTNKWVNTGVLPAQLSTADVGYEMGPAVLLNDGRVFFAGGTNATAYYTPSTNSWTAGPTFPSNYCMADAPGAILPNGNILLAMSPRGGLTSSGYNFPSPTYVYELNPTTNVYTNVTPSLSSFSFGGPSYGYTMLVLPTGQVAVMNFGSVVAVYTESGSPVAAAVPSINGITYGGSSGVYTLSGTNLNGINEGAAYGDDNEMSSNYPLVRLTSASGVVSYARTTNWSNTGVSQGAETVTFTLPASATAGSYLVQSVANGVPSAPVLAVFANGATGTSAGVQTDTGNPSAVDTLANSAVTGTFTDSTFSSILVIGDNTSQTLNVDVNGSLGTTPVTVEAGSATDTININQTSPTGPVLIAPSAGSDAVNVGTTGAGTAIAEFLAAQQIGLLTVGSGGSALVGNGSRILLQSNGIVTTGTGVMDLGTSDMIIHNGDPVAISSQIYTGLNNGSAGPWTGYGITSSAAAANSAHLTAIGVLLNNSPGFNFFNSFDGVPVSGTDVLLKYTYFGDADLNGKVDATDYSRLDSGFLTGGNTWFNGDFNYDTAVNGSDYTLIDNAFNNQGASLAAQVSALTQPVKASSTRSTYVASNLQLASPASVVSDQSSTTSGSLIWKILPPYSYDYLSRATFSNQQILDAGN